MADFSNLGIYQKPGPQLYAANQFGNEKRHDPLNDPLQSVTAQDIDATPLFTAGFGAIAILLLIAMNKAGFRFSFGVSAGR